MAGASGAIFGVAGGLVTVYIPQFRTLVKRQRWNLAILVVWIGVELCDPSAAQLDHLGGLAMGILLGGTLSRRFAVPRASRCWVFGVALLALAACAWQIRLRNPYLVHIDAAMHALQARKNDIASSELQAAIKLNPNSRLAASLLQQVHGGPPSP